EGLDLGLSRASSTGDDGPRVAHPLPLGRAAAGDEADDGLGHLGDEAGRVLFIRAADLTNEDHDLRLGVLFKESEDIDEAGRSEGVPPDADAGRLPQAPLAQLR